ncbi:hypothetical protein NQZ68_039059 [Dissostichus eleginoides]|nr:hypothetical protein NQZ68_039059 [Dissostichus eleginoides]
MVFPKIRTAKVWRPLKDPWRITPDTWPLAPHGHNDPADTDNTFRLEVPAAPWILLSQSQPALSIKAFLMWKLQPGVAARNLHNKLRRSGK